MPDLFTDEYERAKIKWEKSKENYDEAIRLYDAIYILLKHHYEELTEAYKEFHSQQSKAIKIGRNLRSINIKSIRKGE
jgi:hypothetical protein